MPLRSSRVAPVVVDLRRAIGAEHEVAAPGGQLERQAEAALAAAVDRERPIAHFPAVAVRAVEDAAAVQLGEAGDRRQVVDDAGGDAAACATRTVSPVASVTSKRLSGRQAASVTSTSRSSTVS